MAVVISKNESSSSTILSWCLSTKLTTFCLGIISPSTRMRSRKSCRWGEVKSPVRYPACWSTEAMMCDTDPLPFVPATWIVKKLRCGLPRWRQNAAMRSNPGL